MTNDEVASKGSKLFHFEGSPEVFHQKHQMQGIGWGRDEAVLSVESGSLPILCMNQKRPNSDYLCSREGARQGVTQKTLSKALALEVSMNCKPGQ